MCVADCTDYKYLFIFHTIPFLENYLWNIQTIGNGALTISYAVAIYVNNMKGVRA